MLEGLPSKGKALSSNSSIVKRRKKKEGREGGRETGREEGREKGKEGGKMKVWKMDLPGKCRKLKTIKV
jgi:predicted transposase YdaD